VQRRELSPGEDQVIPLAVQMLMEDESRRVRQMAAGVLGRVSIGIRMSCAPLNMRAIMTLIRW
jgi:hypothetical protein